MTQAPTIMHFSLSVRQKKCNANVLDISPEIVNPWRVCAGGLLYLSCVCVCLSVCRSVTTLVATSLVSTLKMRYVGVYVRLFFS